MSNLTVIISDTFVNQNLYPKQLIINHEKCRFKDEIYSTKLEKGEYEICLKTVFGYFSSKTHLTVDEKKDYIIFFRNKSEIYWRFVFILLAAFIILDIIFCWHILPEIACFAIIFGMPIIMLFYNFLTRKKRYKVTIS